MNLLNRLADNENPQSLANKLRRRRFEHFRSFVNDLPRPLSILDVGGTDTFWESMGLTGEADVQIKLINIDPCTSKFKNIVSEVGDGCDLSKFADNSFDVVFSNSVIEHVSSFEQQQRMAEEISRVGKRYFVQTPNFFFPIEPHFLFPCFQFLPFSWRVSLVHKFKLGWTEKMSNVEQAELLVRSVRLLRFSEMKQLFPEGNIGRERFLGLTKSFVVTGRISIDGIERAEAITTHKPKKEVAWTN